LIYESKAHQLDRPTYIFHRLQLRGVTAEFLKQDIINHLEHKQKTAMATSKPAVVIVPGAW